MPGIYLKYAAIAVLLLAVCRPAGAEMKTIYGFDGRFDFYQVENPVERAVMGSAVSLFRLNSGLIPDGEYYRVAGRVLGDEAGGRCPGERFSHQRTGAFCSGTLIAPDLVLTAGHCMTSSLQGPGRCSMTKFVFGFSLASEDAFPYLIPAGEVYSCADIALYAKQGLLDYAVVRLDRPVTGHRPAAMEFGRGTPPNAIFSVGGPYGLPLKVLSGARVRAADPDRGLILTDLDSSGGNSGGGVFNAATGGLIAVHAATRDPDLAEVPLPQAHGLPPDDRRVLAGICLTPARYAQGSGRGKRAVPLSAIPGLKEVTEVRQAADIAVELPLMDTAPSPEMAVELEGLLR